MSSKIACFERLTFYAFILWSVTAYFETLFSKHFCKPVLNWIVEKQSILKWVLNFPKIRN